MSVTVVIPSTLDSPVLDRCVDAVLRSATRVSPDAEVIVVANRVRGGRPPTIRSDRLRVLHSMPDGTATARNTALAAARHDTILFTDDDLIVAPDWCAHLYAALRSGARAVATPVRVHACGPVTAFMNYDRLFNPPPVDATHARLLVTASAGYRRDLVAPGTVFNTDRHQFFGQDTEFALTLTDQGVPIRWLPDAPPPVHHIEEDVASVVTRSVKNGRGSARIYTARRLIHNFLPSALTMYAGYADGTFTGYRRYREIDSVEIRAVFATLNLIRTGLITAGYLWDLGTAYGHAFVDLDVDALVEGSRSVLAGLDDLVARVPQEQWRDIPVRFGAGLAQAPEIGHLVPGTVAEVLNRSAPRTGRPVPRALANILVRDEAVWYRRHMHDRSRLVALWRRLVPDAPTLTLSAFEARVRAVGISLPSALSLLEQIAGQTGQANRWPGAA
jgi:glycosyltransferase involved in cell wall biosynthesis